MRLINACVVVAVVSLLSVRADTIVAEKSASSLLPDRVSIIRLIAAPERFEGRRVRVIGFAAIGFETDSLYVHEEDYLRHISKNALSLRLDHRRSAKDIDLEGAHLKYVIVEGTFSADETGHMESNSGGIVSVTRLAAWEWK